MTALDGTPICDEAMTAGADCVLAKPVDYEELLTRSTRAISKCSGRRLTES